MNMFSLCETFFLQSRIHTTQKMALQQQNSSDSCCFPQTWKAPEPYPTPIM